MKTVAFLYNKQFVADEHIIRGFYALQCQEVQPFPFDHVETSNDQKTGLAYVTLYFNFV